MPHFFTWVNNLQQNSLMGPNEDNVWINYSPQWLLNHKERTTPAKINEILN